MPDDDDSAEIDGVTYGLVMPFVVVESKGGPYDDESFAAGWQCGWIDACLERGSSPAVSGEQPIIVRTQALPQLDLIAMRYGYVLKTKPATYDEITAKGIDTEWHEFWSYAFFDPASEADVPRDL